MAGLITWVSSNWQSVLLVLVTVDQVLVGIFPQVAILGSIGDWLKKISGALNPPAPPAA